MTTNLAWTHNTSAFVIVDSGVTAATQISGWTTSSLGQGSQRADGRFTEEGACKIIQVGPHAVASLCGPEEATTRFAMALRQYHWDRRHPIEDAAYLAHEVASRGGGDFKNIVAFWGQGSPGVAVCTKSTPWQTPPAAHVIAVGTLREPLARLFAGPILSAPNYAPEVELVAGLAVTHSLGLQHTLINDGVGGAFFGASVDAAGVHWQPDLSYVHYDPLDLGDQSHTRLDVVRTSVRDETFIVAASHPDVVRAMGHDALMPDLAAWKDRHRVHINPPVDRLAADWVAFVPKLLGTIGLTASPQDVVPLAPDGQRRLSPGTVEALRSRAGLRELHLLVDVLSARRATNKANNSS